MSLGRDLVKYRRRLIRRAEMWTGRQVRRAVPGTRTTTLKRGLVVGGPGPVGRGTLDGAPVKARQTSAVCALFGHRWLVATISRGVRQERRCQRCNRARPVALSR